MRATRYDEILMRLVKDVADLKRGARLETANLPLFDIASENIVTITTDQNNYNPGNYDVIRIDTGAGPISITGFSGGKKGRFLEIVNAPLGNPISFPVESASSLAANRLSAPFSEDFILASGARIRFYYDYTEQRWVAGGKPTWYGAYGLSAKAYNAAGAQVIATAGADKKVTFDTVVDSWSWWDAANNCFTIPAYGFYIAVGDGDFVANATGVRYGYLGPSGGGAWSPGINVPCQAGTVSRIQAITAGQFDTGDTISFYVYQSSGGNLNFENQGFSIVRIW